MHKTIFLSYTWDNPEHKKWVLNLANALVDNGVDVILDQYELTAGKEMTFFMERAMTADKIVLVLTPDYKKKADSRKGGAGYEYSLVTKDLYDIEPDDARVIPVLRNGDKKSSCPTFIQTRIFHDMTDDKIFDSRLFELIKIIMDEPLVKKPELGKLPDFEKSIPDIEKTIIDFQNKKELIRRKNEILATHKGVELFQKVARDIVNEISEILEKYKTNFGLGFHIIKNERPIGILFSTVNFTFFFSTEGLDSNSAQGAKFILNFFRGPVGLDPGIDYSGKQEVIYRTRYDFDLDSELNPILVRTDNKSVILKKNEVPTIAVREVVVKEIELRSKGL